MRAKTASGNRCHRMADGIEEVHRTKIVCHKAKHGKHNVDNPKLLGSVADARTEFIDLDSRRFGRKQLCFVSLVLLREESHRQHDNAQTAKPLRDAAPQKYSVRLRIDVVHHRGSCGRKSRHSFEKCVGNIVESTAHKIGNHTENGKNQPSKRNGQEIVLLAHFLCRLSAKQEKNGSDKKCCERRNQQRNEILLTVVYIIVQRDECRSQHKHRHHHEILSYNLLFHYIKSKCTKMHIA